MTDPTILYAVNNGVAVITLNRPDKLNAFNAEMHGALREALARAVEDKAVRALVLTGAARGFCTGQDLSDRLGKPGSVDLSSTLRDYYNPLVMTLRSLPFPVIAAVNGAAAGAGANIALACDIVIAGTSAKFIQSFSKIGLIPDSGGTWTLPRSVGRGKAYAMAALSETVSAADAEQCGLIYKTVPDDELMTKAQTIAAQLAALPTDALVTLRLLFDAAEHNTLEQQLALEGAQQSRLGATADYAEGVKAFFEKRAPVYAARK